MKTKTGRVLEIAETSDTGPLSIAQKNNIDEVMANNSLKKIMIIEEFLFP